MEKFHYIEAEDKVVLETIYDATAVIEQNRLERQDAPEHGKYRNTVAGLVKVASIPLEHIEALKNKGYNLLSHDKDEVRRALLYIQQNEAEFLTVNGTPFAKHRPQWR